MVTKADKILGDRLKLIRTENGLTQAEVALRLEMPQSYVSLIESGKRSLSLTSSVRYSLCIGSEPNSLISEAAWAVLQSQDIDPANESVCRRLMKLAHDRPISGSVIAPDTRTNI